MGVPSSKKKKNIEFPVYPAEIFFYFPQALSVNNETIATNKLQSHILVT